MIIGTVNTDLNWDDNPYVKINVYEITEEWKPKISPTVKLHKCSSKELEEIINADKYYPNSLCFQN